jgi:predicted unusual protein kinase regulating ubiquinone biosynthesis (AarF/ABC1/UbiB family)
VLITAAWWDIFLPTVGLRRLSARGQSQRYRRAAAAFRQLAVQMGGVLIKVGQFLSPPAWTCSPGDHSGAGRFAG